MIAAALALLAAGTQSAPRAQSPADGGRLAVYLVTFAPGPVLWERFGHNGLWIRDTGSATGPLYDFGRFDFRQERFFRNFASGRPRYWMGREDGAAVINRYIAAQRGVWLQELAILPEARLRLREALDSAYEADLGVYTYQYYLDNCSTRIRDAIDGAVGGALQEALRRQPAGTTWRFHTRRALESGPPWYFAITAALGPATDDWLTWWEETFLPMKLFEYARGVMVPGPGGTLVPLVRGELQLAPDDRFAVPVAPPDWTSRALLWGLAAGTLLAGLGRLSRRGGWWRHGYLAVAGAWLLLAGVAGAVFLYFWAFSAHTFAWRNQNLWQLNLLSLGLLVLLPAATRGGGPASRGAAWLAWALAGFAVLGLVLVRMGGVFHQDNGDILAFTVPAQVGLALGVLLAVRAPAASGERPALP